MKNCCRTRANPLRRHMRVVLTSWGATYTLGAPVMTGLLQLLGSTGHPEGGPADVSGRNLDQISIQVAHAVEFSKTVTPSRARVLPSKDDAREGRGHLERADHYSTAAPGPEDPRPVQGRASDVM